MHEHQRAILDAYAQDPQAVHSTTELVRTVFPQHFDRIQQDLQSNDQQTIKQAHRNKAKLHRKLLYHIKQLQDKGALKETGTKEHGEKQYALALEAGELVIKGKDRTVAISKHQSPDNYIQEHQQAGRIKQLTTPLHKIEAYALNATQHPGIHHLRAHLPHLYTHISDALAITGFESFLQQPPDVLEEALTALIADSKDYGIAITLHIDLDETRLTTTHLQFLNTYALHHPKRVYLVFAGSYDTLKTQQAMLAQTASTFSKNGVKLNLQNTDRQETPLIMGRAGMYALTKRQQRALDEAGAVVVCNASYTIDMPHTTDMAADAFRTMAVDTAKTLLARTALQRRLAPTTLAGLTSIENLRAQLAAPESYIRIWNYDLEEHPHLALLASTKEQTDRFCKTERTIFAASGVPLHFNTAYSSAFPHYHEDLTNRQYTKAPIYGRESFDADELKTRERLAQQYRADRVRFFREGTYTGEELITELLHVLHTYALAYVTYDFTTLQKTISLERYLQ